jgi:hypothetical protein
MPSSISSSEHALDSRIALERPGFVRLTASDRPGVAQPVPERDIPPQPWRAMFVSAVVLALLALGVWEWRMRALQLVPGDLGDYPSAWAEQRRRVDTEPVPVAIVGDSRILFDTDLDRFEALTGVRPLQLAFVGTNARFLLENLADDADFKGLLIVGISENGYFRDVAGFGADAIKRYAYESPSQRSGQWLHAALSQVFGFLDEDYRLSKLVQRLDDGWRADAKGRYFSVWKVLTMHGARDIKLWSRIEEPGKLQDHARAVWLGGPPQKPLTEATITDTQTKTRDAVAKIRARGGEVVFLRPPSSGPLHVLQNQRIPRALGWDPLLRAANVQGVHFEDNPAMRGLNLPEYSHLSPACASVYTDAYVRALARLTPRLQLRADAPPALTPANCVAPETRVAIDGSAVALSR